MKNIYLLIAVLALAFTTSCEKGFLDTAPTSSISEESVFSTSENAMMAINGIHRRMHEGHSSGTTTSWNGQGGYPTFCMHLALMTDDVVWISAGFHKRKSIRLCERSQGESRW